MEKLNPKRDDLVNEIVSRFPETASKYYIIKELVVDIISSYSIFAVVDLIKECIDAMTKRMKNVESHMYAANERIGYVKEYLKGNMYTSKKASEEALPIQIKNAEEAYKMTSKNAKYEDENVL